MPEQAAFGQIPEGQRRADYKNLDTLLRRCGVPLFDKRRMMDCFWPAQLLQRIMTRDRVVEELWEYKIGSPGSFHEIPLDALADIIMRHYRKVFAVLVLIGKGDLIQAAINEQWDDTQLPLLAYGPNNHLYSKKPPNRLAQCFERHDWKPVHRQLFAEYQYAVDPCIFTLEVDGSTPKHRVFHDKVVLPFTDEAERHSGGYGIVTKVAIHEHCHEFHALLQSINTDNSFARKQLMNDDAKEFEDEAAALRRFNGFGNDHMVTLLMTWTQHRSYNLLFPWAKCDLDNYWARDPLPIMDAETIVWTSKQVTGIASAIKSIHNPSRRNLQVPDDNKYGRHGDLKPENILLFDSPLDKMGILVVADLGLAKLNSIVSRSMQSNHKIPGTPRYKPPECDIEGAKIARTYDIWTFGCLLLEWICWLFQGQNNKALFIWQLGSLYPTGSIGDTFYSMDSQGNGRYLVTVKSKVLEKFAELHADEKCTEYFHDLLHIIEERMLVIRARSRVDSETLFQSFNRMHQKVLQDETYCYSPCKSSRKIGPQEPLDVEFRKTDPRGNQPR
ncbi:kinase-like domain-containing protein [Paraphoma chrysanthemicola]|uniref:Kinase-like domain-containing protein n=1 Tax=Paraphoma chrysanthemicola TaxID=798071 RepID=A0A8K0RCZ3_9PLEO|nr:kinase-like domain-containing protein [Paraphoma chrysanthemicola]